MNGSTHRLLLGVFEREEDMLTAIREVRRQGLTVVEAYAPYAVHGLDRALGLRPTRLPWICFVLGLIGAALKIWFEFWTTAVSWPINVGGKPWNSLPAFVPVTFEVMVLFAGLGVVIAFLSVCGLRPGRRAVLPDPRVTSDRFVVILEEKDAAFDAEKVSALLGTLRAVRVEERVAEVLPR